MGKYIIMNNLLYYILMFLLGIIFGSFYNVIIYRLPLNMSISKGRSMCFNCKHTLGVLDLIPLFSYIFLKGRCRYCKAKFSPRYFIIEFITGTLFVLSLYFFGTTIACIYFILFWSMLLITAVIDYDEGYIYTNLLLSFLAPAVIIKFLLFKHNFLESLISGLVGFVIYYVIYFVSKKIYKKEAFGLGDVQLMCVIGLFLDTKLTILTSFLSFIVALVFIIVFSLFGKKINLAQEVPFGPYMCITAFIVSIYGDRLINWYISLAFS